MRISLIGAGKMSKAVQELAVLEGHQIVRVLDLPDNPAGSPFEGDWVGETDVLVDFSTASAVPSNVAKACAAGLPIVEGTTGWQNQLDEVRGIVEKSGGSCLHSSNFSLGVQALFFLTRQAGKLFSKLEGYAPFIEERHHSQKLDAPSGTAVTLSQILAETGISPVPVSAVRAGFYPGLHEVGFDSAVDTLTLTHSARNRGGFARGALFACQWIIGKKGFFDLQEVLFRDSQ